jgi:membrane protein
VTTSNRQPDHETVTHTRGGLIEFGRELVGEAREDDILGLAAEVAFHAIFALPALLVLFVALAGVIDSFTAFDLAEQLRELIDRSAPEPTKDILDTLIESAVQSAGGEAASIGLITSTIVALWAGSNGIVALMKAFNRAYDTGDDRSFLHKRIVALNLTVVLGVIVNLSFALWVFGGDLGNLIASEFNRGDSFNLFWNIIRWPAGIVVFAAMLSVLYYFGPNVEQRYHLISPGPVVATVLWLGAVFGFSTYLQFTAPGSAYGALSGAIVFVLFLYLTAIVILVGAEIDAIVARHHRIKAGRAALEYDVLPEPAGVGTVGPATVRWPGPQPSWRGLMVGALTTVAVIAVSILNRRERP